ncbi:toll/interleukin-1 receptor domain-containing protein [candidate division KSB1 bacterium]|nr:toll/interleukin-1 receptor domain-containing protein [candidate division KSB1 bacterium]
MKKSAQIFLCYARKDAAPVSALYEKLSLARFQPFMDTKDILPGENWKQVLK